MTIKYDGEDDGFAGKRQPIAMNDKLISTPPSRNDTIREAIAVADNCLSGSYVAERLRALLTDEVQS
jgi:hypothetical protein